jgi:uncharacterized membrane protein
MYPSNAELMREARESLRGQWSMAVAGTALFLAVMMGVGAVPKVGFFLSLVAGGPMLLGWSRFTLGLVRRQDPGIGVLFSGFDLFPTALAVQLYTALLVFLWSLLLVIPGIAAGLSFAATWYLLADDGSRQGVAAARRSREIMRGQRWRYFRLGLRFLGWFLVGFLTLGIAFLWIIPYYKAASALFYQNLVGQGVEPPPPAPQPLVPA